MKVYHGKVGRGLSVEMSVKRGPVNLCRCGGSRGTLPEGATVFLRDRNANQLAIAAEQLGKSKMVSYEIIDVSEVKSVAAAARAAIQKHGKIECFPDQRSTARDAGRRAVSFGRVPGKQRPVEDGQFPFRIFGSKLAVQRTVQRAPVP